MRHLAGTRDLSRMGGLGARRFRGAGRCLCRTDRRRGCSRGRPYRWVRGGRRRGAQRDVGWAARCGHRDRKHRRPGDRRPRRTLWRRRDMQLAGDGRCDTHGLGGRANRLAPNRRPHCGELLRRDRSRHGRHWTRSRQRRSRRHDGIAAVVELVDRDVIDRRDVGDVGDMRVHVTHVALAGVVPGPVHLPGCQRAPADRAADCHADRDADTRADAEERNQCRGIDRRHADRCAGHPAPALADPCPTPIVEWRKPPLGLIHPGPAPRLYVGPASVMVGRPPRRDRRIPDLAVLRRGLPGADTAQVRPARQRRYERRGCGGGRDCGRGDRPGAGQHRRQERILRRGPDAALETIGASERRRLTWPDAQRGAGIRDLGRTVDHSHHGRRHGIAGDDLIVARGGDGNRAAWRLQHHRLVLRQADHAHVDLALRHRRRRAGGVERCKVHLGRAVHGEPDAAELKVRPRVRLGPERVAGDHRIIERRWTPVRVVRGVERDRAGDQRQPPDACRRIRRRLRVGG